MEHTRIFSSTLGRVRTAAPHLSTSKGDRRIGGKNAQPPNEAEYDSDEINSKGAMNNSCLSIVDSSEFVEPPGWYIGRLYYVVTRGSAVGIFHKLEDVYRHTDSIPTSHWEICKTWKGAVAIWDLAYYARTIVLLRDEARKAIRRLMTGTPEPHLELEMPTTSRTLVPKRSASHVQTPTSTAVLPASKKRLPSVIVISDSDSDSDIEVTYPKKIRKLNDHYELTDDENNEPYLRKTYDAVTNKWL